MTDQKYDIIGDIHGHANDLESLLYHMNYENSHGYFQHATRKAIFLGDFIDRGVNQKAVLDIVIPMVTNKSALAVMGNHEFNALAFHTLHPNDSSTWLRERNNKNISQHLAFLADYSSPGMAEELQCVLDFFMSLPLFLELDELRIVHACWHDKYIKIIRDASPSCKLNPELLVEASNKGTLIYNAIETILKGVEVELPEDINFIDKDGHERDAVRVQWWDRKAINLGDVALPVGVELGHAKSLPIPDYIPHYGKNEPPCFIGHYWLKGKPEPRNSNVACLDYSVAKNGKLVAYRWDGETKLKTDKFTYLSPS